MRIKGLFPLLISSMLYIGCTSDYQLREIKNPDSLFTREFILTQMKQTADWQLKNMPQNSWSSSQDKWVPIEDNGWIRSAFYTGVMATYHTTNDTRFLDATIRWGNSNNWEPATRPRHADDQCCIQSYVDVFLIDKDPAKIKPAIQTFEPIILDPMPGSTVGWKKDTNWSWCDAIFMAPPAMTRLAAATEEEKYLELMDALFWDTFDYLYDKNEHLFYRDDRFKPDADPVILSDNGKPVFWSRGNGWVLAGLARVLQFMPESYPSKIKYESVFRNMAAKLITLQDTLGFWHSNLLDPISNPEPESSGTAFFCYGLAWGVNNDLLDRQLYLPAIKKGWIALNRCLDDNGQLHWVQLVGSAPAPVKYENSVEYATGAFLLAGSEIIKLVNEPDQMMKAIRR